MSREEERRERFVIPDLQRIGKYDILERIADGGFATLYRGRDPFLKRLVAIKVCLSEDGDLRQQFLREAEIAGNLDHPSIVRTFDFGFDPAGPYLVQEYLHGEDLSQLIAERAPLSTRRKLDLLIQVAEGLSYSHAHLVLHLDIKPGNVRVIGRRRAKILDFGIARLAVHDAAPADGSMIGTAGYLPPEQVMGKSLDGRADIFAFGAMAYELLTFYRPFTGGTIPKLLKRVLGSEADPMTRHWPDCDDALSAVIGRCLRREPSARYPSFDVLLPELVAIRDASPDDEDDGAEDLGFDTQVTAVTMSRPGATSSGAARSVRPPSPADTAGGVARSPSGDTAHRVARAPSPADTASGVARPSSPADTAGGVLPQPSPADTGSGIAPPPPPAPREVDVDATVMVPAAVVEQSADELPADEQPAEPPLATIGVESTEPAPADTAGAAAASVAEPTAGGLHASTQRIVFSVLAVLATVLVIAGVAILPQREPAPEPAPEPVVPVRASGPAPGILIVTAAPWGEVTRVIGPDGHATQLPADRVTPLRLWVAPGTHLAEVKVGEGSIETCRVDVTEGGTHVCQAAQPDVANGSVDYFKEMGWWQ